ncbi:MAG: lysophospholipid acyltransferase family protein [Chitinophagales bacterium]|jgi:KDO2-lipid IV(A) lauroyltransferase|nr:lysophospholipid acyltransferase family protein [Sphingobacteriales bacterium]
MKFLLKLLIYTIYQLESLQLGYLVRRFIYFILARILRYRAKVIDKNLAFLYPNITSEESHFYKRKFYNHMADLIVGTLWCFRANPEELKPKVLFKNPEVINQILESGQNATILLSHIGNWELFCQWASLYEPRINIVILYTQIKNKKLNNYILSLRQRFGAYLVSTKATLDLYRAQKTKNVCLNFFAIDQNPGDPYNQHWLNFFGQSVPVISGAEKFVKSQSQKAYFLYVTKGECYEFELIELIYDSSLPYDLTEKQFALLEKNILENPSLWLLSHNRFKYAKTK